MVIAIAALHVLVSFLIIFFVLIQGGENVDITAAFGGVSQTAFGPRGAVSGMAKITWVLFAIFMFTSVTLTVVANKRSSGSIMENLPAKSAPVKPGAPTPKK